VRGSLPPDSSPVFGNTSAFDEVGFQNFLTEAIMRSPIFFRTLAFALLLLISFGSAAAFAQSPADDLGALPTTLSGQQLESLSLLAPSPLDASQQTHARRRLPIPVIPLTPEELGYRDAVRGLGTDDHRFVHFELSNGKVLTGPILSIGDRGFAVRNGIFGHHSISYSELKAAPYPVAAVGTHLVNALKWTGVVAGCIAVIPLAAVFYPLVMAGVIQD
jgi:hypothetical protein